jgi:hypothetical protein
MIYMVCAPRTVPLPIPSASLLSGHSLSRRASRGNCKEKHDIIRRAGGDHVTRSHCASTHVGDGTTFPPCGAGRMTCSCSRFAHRSSSSVCGTRQYTSLWECMLATEAPSVASCNPRKFQSPPSIRAPVWASLAFAFIQPSDKVPDSRSTLLDDCQETKYRVYYGYSCTKTGLHAPSRERQVKPRAAPTTSERRVHHQKYTWKQGDATYYNARRTSNIACAITSGDRNIVDSFRRTKSRFVRVYNISLRTGACADSKY